MRTLIKNAKTLGKYLGKNDELVEAELLIENGKIKKLTSQIFDEADQVIEASGKLLLPGLIDPQVHFREPGQEYKEDLESGSKSAARGGFTTVICMPNTNPTTDEPEIIKKINQRVKEIGLCRVLPTAAVTKGLMGSELTDYQALKEAGTVAFTDDGKGVQSDEVMLKAMSEIAKTGLPLLDHSEDESLSLGGSIHKGEISQKYNIPGIDHISEAAHVARGCEYAGKTGCHFHVLHVSTKASLDYIKEAKEKGWPVTAEVSPHHLLLCDEDIPEREPGKLDPNWKMNPPLRSKSDRAACVEALESGVIDMIATDHAPHSTEEKAREITKAPFGIVGLETSFPLIYTYFVKTGILSLERAVDMMTTIPAKLFHLPYGTLNEGASADVTLVDLESEEIINSSNFLSKGKNTPFNGRKVKGNPKLTIFSGKIVFNELF